jgi:predicted Zn-dependent protease
MMAAMRFPSRPRLGRRAWPVLLAAALAALPAHGQLPTLGDSSEMSTAAERRMGERIARELFRDPDYIDDPVLVEYVRRIWQPLLDAARARGELSAELEERFAWQVLLGKDRMVNAFALPGGWLGLNLGLISVTTSADELASVLAHELSHVTQRHIARMFSQEKRNTPLVIGAMILGALAASKAPQAAQAVIAGSQAGAAQNQLNFSRDMEREADRIGFGVMTAAGFQPQAFASMFEKLQQGSRLNDNGAYPYLRSHPLTTERMADMQSRIQLDAKPAPARATALLEHALMSGRARALSAGGVDMQRALVAEAAALQPNAPRVRAANVLYAGAVSAMRLRDVQDAIAFAERLDTLVQDEPAAARHARLLRAELALASGRVERANALLDPASQDRPQVLLWSHTRLAAGDGAAVVPRLEQWVATQPRDATAWQLLATAAASQGQSLRALRAEAEAQVARLDYPAAVDRFKAAQQLARRGGSSRGDYIEASIIDTRLKQVESLVREQALER